MNDNDEHHSVVISFDHSVLSLEARSVEETGIEIVGFSSHMYDDLYI